MEYESHPRATDHLSVIKNYSEKSTNEKNYSRNKIKTCSPFCVESFSMEHVVEEMIYD